MHIYGSGSPGRGKWSKCGIFQISEQLRKVEKIKLLGHSRASKKKPHFGHFPCPGESADSYVCQVLINMHINILQLHHGGRGCSRRLEEVPWS